ncbi:hypothetical protein NESM_000845300 [Novymonas esmeraldas]|uniref:Uncharacterized protein n=1 Tax=Novymonas esmeraldas TaxID=1808958 RepID=A0AAW0EWY2_9TRYP
MADSLQADASADVQREVAAVTDRNEAVPVDIHVQLIGVVGCSASGKSTVAHHLACQLRSPLHPISTDAFFSDVYEQLGTFEDARCIDYAAMARWMQVMVHAVPTVSVTCRDNACAAASASSLALEHRAQRAWWAQMRVHLPEAESYARVDPGSALDGTSVSTCCAASTDDGEGSDVSLHAHEAEDAELRQRCTAFPAAAAAATVTGTGADAVALTRRHRPVTVYVVWEGFTLLCSRLVNAHIDCAIHVRCDAETACLRRFLRSPRRHLLQHVAAHSPTAESEVDEARRATHATIVSRVVRQTYQSRILKMWRTRAHESHRLSLAAALAEEMRLDDDAATLSRSVDSSCASPATPTSPHAVQDALRLLEATCFNPPRPRGAASASPAQHAVSCDGEDGSQCWTADGMPTLQFQRFWETDFDSWLAAQSTAAGALAWASLSRSGAQAVDCSDEVPHASPADGRGGLHSSTAPTSVVETDEVYVRRVLAERARLALQQQICPSDAAPAGDDGALSSALMPFYHEFRYWFFFEVLFYDRVYRPLQAHRLRWRSAAAAATGGANTSVCDALRRRWWTLDNGRGAQGRDGDVLAERVEGIAMELLGCVAHASHT